MWFIWILQCGVWYLEKVTIGPGLYVWSPPPCLYSPASPAQPTTFTMFKTDNIMMISFAADLRSFDANLPPLSRRHRLATVKVNHLWKVHCIIYLKHFDRNTFICEFGRIFPQDPVTISSVVKVPMADNSVMPQAFSTSSHNLEKHVCHLSEFCRWSLL